jgi:hypothetical protein
MSMTMDDTAAVKAPDSDANTFGNAVGTQQGHDTVNATSNTNVAGTKDDITAAETTDSDVDTVEAVVNDQCRRDRESVKQEIEAVIAPWRSSEEKPPFTAAELIVMAILCISKHAVMVKEIVTWVVRTFAHYRELVLEQWAESCSSSIRTTRSSMVVDGFYEVFDDFDVPLRDPNNVETIRKDLDYVERLVDGFSISVSPAAGRVFLRNILEPRREGVFDFLRLPAELRNRIYDMVFTLPESGVSTSIWRSGTIQLMERNTDHLTAKPCWHDSWTRFSMSATQQQGFFALLSVNKQI